MITVEEALQLIENNIKPLTTEKRQVTTSLGYVLATNISSPINMPPFPQSAMDGYAVAYTENVKEYALIGEVAAGSSGEEYNLQTGETVRIFTGAPVPKGANTVVKQEIAERNEDTISFTEEVAKNQNVRPLGEQIQENELALPKGTLITPAGVGFLAGIGITEIDVFKKPRINVIATGNELVKPGNPLPPGKIYESNSFMLIAALEQFNFTDVTVATIGDTYEATLSSIKTALENTDVLLLSGGISVGDYDFVGKALLELGVEKVFYKVKQKPGKPLFFGTYQNKVIFALPGNPAAAMTSFYTYVLPSLHQLSSNSEKGLLQRNVPLAAAYIKKGDRAVFLKATVTKDGAEILDKQSSAMLKTFATSNALVYIPHDKNEVQKGELVKSYLLY